MGHGNGDCILLYFPWPLVARSLDQGLISRRLSQNIATKSLFLSSSFWRSSGAHSMRRPNVLVVRSPADSTCIATHLEGQSGGGGEGRAALPSLRSPLLESRARFGLTPPRPPMGNNNANVIDNDRQPGAARAARRGCCTRRSWPGRGGAGRHRGRSDGAVSLPPSGFFSLFLSDESPERFLRVFRPAHNSVPVARTFSR